jgi:hypothetical protein
LVPSDLEFLEGAALASLVIDDPYEVGVLVYAAGEDASGRGDGGHGCRHATKEAAETTPIKKAGRCPATKRQDD